MSNAERFQLVVDFLYGGRDPSTNEWVVGLEPKGHRGLGKGIRPAIGAQFEASCIEPVDGMSLVLIDPHCDSDDEGRLCDMVVPGTLRWSSELQHWYATYDHSEMTWIPSVTE